MGPGGGRLLSNALCIAVVDLPVAVCAHLDMPFSAPALATPLGLARALVAIARQAGNTTDAGDPGRAARQELGRLGGLPESALVGELASHVHATAWPAWAPNMAFALPRGGDIAILARRTRAPDTADGIACPLQAARLVAAVRGPVFLRDAAPALSNLLNLQDGAAPSGGWEIWLPVAPGSAHALPTSTVHSTRGATP